MRAPPQRAQHLHSNRSDSSPRTLEQKCLDH